MLKTKIDKALILPLVRRATFKKYINLIKQNKNAKQKAPYLNSFPSIAIIEPTNSCNLKCPLCPSGQRRFTNRGYMGLELYEKILTQLAPYIFEVWLYNWGEPFLNKDIFKIIQFTQKSNAATTISSNLNYLPDNYEFEMVKSGLERLVVSFDGMTQDTYSAYRRGGRMDAVIDNIKRIQNAKKILQIKYPLVKIQFLVNKFNEHQIEEAKTFAAENDLEIEFKPLQFNSQDPDQRTKWEPTTKKYPRQSYLSGAERELGVYWCDWLWKYAVINWDGTISPCCNWIEKGVFEFGDLKKQSFKEIWNNEYFVSARMAINNKHSDVITACTGCLGNPPAIEEL